MSPGPEKSHKERSEGPVHFSLAAWLKLRHGLRGRRQGEQRMPIQGARGFPGRRPDLCGRRNSGTGRFSQPIPISGITRPFSPSSSIPRAPITCVRSSPVSGSRTAASLWLIREWR